MPNYLMVAGGVLDTNQPWSVRMYGTSGSTEGTVASTWDSGITALWNTAAFLALMPTTNQLTYTYASTLDANWHQTTKTQSTHAIAGTATQALPPHICETITWRTNKATRYGRGRWYLPPLGSGALATAGVVLSATAVTDIVTAVNNFLVATVGTIQYVVLHRKGTKGGLAPLSTDNIIAGDVPNRFTTQRRRDDKATVTRSTLTF